eukprot:RCo009838
MKDAPFYPVDGFEVVEKKVIDPYEAEEPREGPQAPTASCSLRVGVVLWAIGALLVTALMVQHCGMSWRRWKNDFGLRTLLPIDHPRMMGGRRGQDRAGPVLVDPLDDLSQVTVARGVRPAQQQGCLVCFFNDTGRVERASGSEDSFLVYRAIPGLFEFSVVAHTFRPVAVEDSPSVQFFTTSDSTLQSWTMITPSYSSLGSRMSWEKGLYTGAPPPTAQFIKIVLSGPVEDPWSPQLGQVTLLGLAEEPDEEAEAEGPRPDDEGIAM